MYYSSTTVPQYPYSQPREPVPRLAITKIPYAIILQRAGTQPRFMQDTPPIPSTLHPKLTMPSKISPAESTEQPVPSTFQRQSRKVTDLFAIPAPVKKLFDLVPITTYAPNPLPPRGPTSIKIPSLYVFTTESDAAAGRPSFNPTCLKWQVSKADEQAIFPPMLIRK